MPILTVKASFKNSRISPRAATTTADTLTVSVLGGGSNTLVLASDTSRTYATIRNTSLTDNIRYSYSDDPLMLTQGMPLLAGEAVDIESPTAIYARSEAGAVSVTIDLGRG